MIDNANLFQAAQRDAYEALAEHYRRIQSGLWLGGYYWRSFQGAMAIVVVLGGVVMLRPPMQASPGSLFGRLLLFLPMDEAPRGPILHVLLIGIFVVGIGVLAIAARHLFGQESGARRQVAKVLWFCVLTPSYLLFAVWFVCFGAGGCAPQTSAWVGVMLSGVMLLLLLNLLALLLATLWVFAAGALGWWLLLIASKPLSASPPLIFPSHDDLSMVVHNRLQDALENADVDALDDLIEQSRQKRDSLAAQMNAAGPSIGALGLGGLLALLFTQQELRIGMAHLESFFWQEKTGNISIALGLLVVALIVLAVRWFLSVAVTMRVLDCVIFAVQALRAEQNDNGSDPEVGYRLKRGILVPKPHTVDRVRSDTEPRRTGW
jgi:hypothetical protein